MHGVFQSRLVKDTSGCMVYFSYSNLPCVMKEIDLNKEKSLGWKINFNRKYINKDTFLLEL